MSYGMEMEGARSRPLKDRVDLPPDAVSTFLQTARLRVGSGLSLLSRLCPSEAGEGFYSFEGPFAGSMSSTVKAGPGSETQEGTIHLLGLQPYGRAWNR
jgi:hypothetical protein